MGTSFYGGGGVVINGGFGSSDYTDLINVPIQVLKGTSIQPIVFSELEYGNYLVQGHFRYNQNDTVYIESTPTNVQIFQDEITLKKIAKTEIFENGEYYLVALIYEDDGSYSIKKFSFSAGGGGGEAPSEEVLEQTIQKAVTEANTYTRQMMTLNTL